jgi:predicted dehydrogenase
MSERKLRIGIVGGGAIMRERHMPALAKREDVELVAVCNRRVESSRQFADDFGIPRVCYNWEEVTKIDDLDVVWVATPPDVHCPIATAALERGKHVFCQSPMARNLDEARLMVGAARRFPDRLLYIAPPPVGYAGDAAMRRLLTDERFAGNIRQVTLASVTGHLLDPDYPANWRLQSEYAGQNMLTLTLYLTVLMRWLGPVRHVLAVTRSWTTQRRNADTQQRVPTGIPESANVLLEFASGAVGNLLINAVSSHGPSDHVSIHGTEGTLVYDFNLDPDAERIEAARRGEEGMTPVAIPDYERRRWDFEGEFLAAVRSVASDPLRSCMPAAEVMATVEAVNRSAATHRRTTVPALFSS